MNDKIEITIKNPDGKQITIITSQDSNIEEWRDVFKTILTFQTFDSYLIKETFNEE